MRDALFDRDEGAESGRSARNIGTRGSDSSDTFAFTPAFVVATCAEKFDCSFRSICFLFLQVRHAYPNTLKLKLEFVRNVLLAVLCEA